MSGRNDDGNEFGLLSRVVGGLPIVNHMLDRLGLPALAGRAANRAGQPRPDPPAPGPEPASGPAVDSGGKIRSDTPRPGGGSLQAGIT
jgi:hypothetical protein